jgi:hypothetical protein
VVVTGRMLQEHINDWVFVFGDNLLHKGYRGAATLRGYPNAWGFITKKYPNNENDSFYKVGGYQSIFDGELCKLELFITLNPNKKFLISQLGSGLANRYGVWEKVIKPGLECLRKHPNVIFLWEVDSINA